MPDLLLKTKFSEPLIRKDLVERPRLIDKLNIDLTQAQGFARKLTLVSAPAGYGKTTIVADWIHHAGLRSVWLSLEEGDNDPARFLAYLVATLQQVDAEVGAAAHAMIKSPQPPPGEMVITALINDLADFPAPFFLVLDDYHNIHNPVIHREVGFLLDHQPPSFHLVILSREDPFLPVSRLRSRGQVCEIRQEDLRFTPAETGVFLQRIMGLNLSSDDIHILQIRTEGWVTGLQLAALSMKGFHDLHQFVSSFVGSDRFILDYLFDEILAQQPLEVKNFLTWTSFLERLTADLCDAVTGRSDSGDLLSALERANLFVVPLDPLHEWYRYHQLFAELLRHQLRLQSRSTENLIHQRACAWFEAVGSLDDAIRHAIAAQDWPSAARLIIKSSSERLSKGEFTTLIGWYGKLPQEVMYAQPQLCLTFAWAFLLVTQYDRAEILLDRAESLVLPATADLGEVAAAQAYLARAKGDNTRLIEESRLALSLLPQEDLTTRGNVALNLGLTYWHEGRLVEAENALLEAQEFSQRVGNDYAFLTAKLFLIRTQATRGHLRQAVPAYHKLLAEGGKAPILALAHYDLSVIYYEWNLLQKAREHLQRGQEISAHIGIVEFQFSGLIQKVFLDLAEGNLEGAKESVEQSHTMARDLSVTVQARSAACHVQLALALRDVNTAAYWAEQTGNKVDAHSFYRFLGLAQPRLLIAKGYKRAAEDLLVQQYQTADQAGWGFARVAVRVLQALAASTTETALTYLTEALRISHADSFIRTFADGGEKIGQLLREAAKRGILPEDCGQILAAIGGDQKTHPGQPALVEPLSGRELEVLRLVTAGLSNREIAEKLVISPGTAKTHVHNLCGKLGARNRTEATTRAKELSLV
jgi:LuxR family maltose regulon positive regulatory protein